METKPISYFKSQFIWAVVLVLVTLSGLIFQLALDVYPHIYETTALIAGWQCSFVSLIAVILVLFIWTFSEFSSLIDMFQSVILKKDTAIQILADKNYNVASIILLLISIPIAYLSCASMLLGSLDLIGESMDGIFEFMICIYVAEIVVLLICMIAKRIIYIFFTNKEGRVIQKQLKE